MTRIIPPGEVVNSWSTDNRDYFNKHMAGDTPDGKRRMDGSGMSKDEFVQQAKQAYETDIKRMQQLQAKRAKLMELMQYRPAFGQEDAFERIDEIDRRLAALQSDIEYNRNNINSSNPNSPPLPPVVPTPPGQFYVCTGQAMLCSVAIPGSKPTFVANPKRTVWMGGKQMGNVTDAVFFTNYPIMGLCPNSGPVPLPCLSVSIPPWMPGKTNVLIENAPALVSTDTLQCARGGRLLFIPTPSNMGANVADQALEEVRDATLQALLKQLKMFKNAGGNKAFGPVVGIFMDLWSHFWSGQFLQTPRNFDQLGEKASQYWKNVSKDDGVLGNLEKSGDVIRGFGDLLTDTLSATGGEVLGEPGAIVLGGVGVAVKSVVLELPAAGVEAVVGAGESLGSGITLKALDDSYYNDTDIFGDSVDYY